MSDANEIVDRAATRQEESIDRIIEIAETAPASSQPVVNALREVVMALVRIENHLIALRLRADE